MSNNATPDSWDSQDDMSPSDDPASQLSKLNVNAAEFVPCFTMSSSVDKISLEDSKSVSPMDTGTPNTQTSGENFFKY